MVKAKADYVCIEKAKNFQWYYTVCAANHKVRETSETYVRRSNCLRAARQRGLDIYRHEGVGLILVESAP